MLNKVKSINKNMILEYLFVVGVLIGFFSILLIVISIGSILVLGILSITGLLNIPFFTALLDIVLLALVGIIFFFAGLISIVLGFAFNKIDLITKKLNSYDSVIRRI